MSAQTSTGASHAKTGASAGKRYRVVQWATGNIGTRGLRRAIEHPDLDVVGVWVHSDAKVGRDAGELCGLAPIGVAATNSIEDIIALKPDCVLYMPYVMKLDEVCRLLESGVNISTTCVNFQNPAMMDPAVREAVAAACQRGGSSIHGTGSSPGFITEAIPIVLASLQRRFDSLTIYEYAPCESRNSPEVLFQKMGFSADPKLWDNEDFKKARKFSFGGSLSLIADAIGLPFDSVEVDGGFGIARNDTQIAAGVVPAGTIAATRTVISGIRDGKALMRMIILWSVSSDVETTDGEEWHFRESGWRVVVEGDCPMDVNITFPVAPEDYPEMTPGLTANRPVNCVSYICEALPGIQPTVNLPQVIAKFA